MTLRRIVRGVAAAAGTCLAGVVLFDLAAYFLFPGLVQRIAPKYASEVGAEVLREARVEPYYRASASRGFDIRPGARSLDWHPPDVEPYPVWGNSLGCFDDEPPAGAAPDIHLAGDSFTWGFSPHETKFGTIIERETGLLVHACGVWHTGQRHQFDKFLEVAESYPGWPALVIVNVYDNDYVNDLAHPHSTVVNGLLVETKHLRREGGTLRVEEAANYKKVVPSLGLMYFLKTYSATANIVNVVMRDTVSTSALGHVWVGGVPDEQSYPIRSEAAAANRRAITGWIDHAREHGYAIRFALIPDREDFGNDIYRELEAFLRERGAVAWDFEDYVLARGLEPRRLYWPVDIHFNPRGNAAYARFLLGRLAAEGRAGTLPGRFAEAGPAGAQ